MQPVISEGSTAEDQIPRGRTWAGLSVTAAIVEQTDAAAFVGPRIRQYLLGNAK